MKKKKFLNKFRDNEYLIKKIKAYTFGNIFLFIFFSYFFIKGKLSLNYGLTKVFLLANVISFLIIVFYILCLIMVRKRG